MEATAVKNINKIDAPYRCLIRENAYFWIVDVFFETGRIERIKRYGRAISREASKLGVQKSEALGIPYFRNKKNIPGFISAQQKAKQERKEAKIKQRILDWQEWRKQYDSDAIAVAELVCYLNRYIKRFSEQERRKAKYGCLQEVYEIKDEWLELNSKNITSAVISAQFNRRIYICENLYEEVDWGLLYSFLLMKLKLTVKFSNFIVKEKL